MKFSSDEITKYLSNSPSQGPVTILLQRAHDHKSHPISLEEFETYFKITYRQHLTFPSEKMFYWLLRQCPYLLRCSKLAEENQALFKRHQQAIDTAQLAPMSIRWINPIKRYGAFAEETLKQGEFVAEYTGLVRRLSRLTKETNPYCFHYPTRFWSFHYAAIDSERQGNLSRFFNHSEEPTLQPHCLVDRNLLHTVFIAKRTIAKGEELTFNYGYSLNLSK